MAIVVIVSPLLFIILWAVCSDNWGSKFKLDQVRFKPDSLALIRADGGERAEENDLCSICETLSTT